MRKLKTYYKILLIVFVLIVQAMPMKAAVPTDQIEAALASSESMKLIQELLTKGEFLKSAAGAMDTSGVSIYPLVHIKEDTALLPYLLELYLEKRIARQEPYMIITINMNPTGKNWADFTKYSFSITITQGQIKTIAESDLIKVQDQINKKLATLGTLDQFAANFPKLVGELTQQINDLVNRAIKAIKTDGTNLANAGDSLLIKAKEAANMLMALPEKLKEAIASIKAKSVADTTEQGKNMRTAMSTVAQAKREKENPENYLQIPDQGGSGDVGFTFAESTASVKLTDAEVNEMMKNSITKNIIEGYQAIMNAKELYEQNKKLIDGSINIIKNPAKLTELSIALQSGAKDELIKVLQGYISGTDKTSFETHIRNYLITNINAFINQ